MHEDAHGHDCACPGATGHDSRADKEGTSHELTSCRSRSMLSSFSPCWCSSSSVLAASSFVRSAVCSHKANPESRPIESTKQ